MKQFKLGLLVVGLVLSIWSVSIAFDSPVAKAACGSYYGSYSCVASCALSYAPGCGAQPRYDNYVKTVQVYQNGLRVTGGTYSGYQCGGCSTNCPASTC